MAFNAEVLALLNKEFKGEAKISRVSEDLRGKVIVLYGGNNVGKTKQSSKFENPIFLPVEKGMNAINGAMVLPTASWSDLKKNGRKLTSKKFKQLLDNGVQMTIVVDGMERLGNYAKDYLCTKYEVATIGKANGGFGAWEEYENMIWSWVDNIISIGYTVVFIGHEKFDNKKDKYVITGDERAIKPIRDNADIVCYLKSNGVDDSGKEIKSSAYLAETDEYFARTRFTHMDTYIEEFTAENLKEAIVEGIRKQNKEEGVESVSFEEQQKIYNNDETFEEVVEEIKELFVKMNDLDALDQYSEIVEDHLGDTPVSEATKGQLDLLKCIRDELEESLEELE